jgi:hypothetical protein
MLFLIPLFISILDYQTQYLENEKIEKVKFRCGIFIKWDLFIQKKNTFVVFAFLKFLKLEKNAFCIRGIFSYSPIKFNKQTNKQKKGGCVSFFFIFLFF